MTAPTPTELKLVRGTQRADRANAAEPKPAVLEVGTKPPSWLKGPRRRRAWAELAELLRGQHLLTVMDTAALAMLVDAYGDYLEASDLINGQACSDCGRPMTSRTKCASGDHNAGQRYYTTTTREGSLMIRPHPAMAVRQDAWKRLALMLSRFGMDPSSRTKVTAVGGEERDPMADLLDGVG